MATEIRMPQFGVSMETGTVAQWLKAEGDTVKAGDVLASIETEKLTNDVVSEVDGVLLKIVAQEGEDIPVQGLMAYIGQPGEVLPDAGGMAAPAAAADTTPAAAEHVPAPAGQMSGGRVKASPLARKIAAKLGVDLSQVTPGGTSGRIRADDVRAYAAQAPTAPAAPAPAPAAAAPAPAAAAAEQMDGDTVEKLSGMRKVVAQRMQQSHTEIPPVTQVTKVDVTALMQFRRELLEKTGKKYSVNDLILKATAKCLAAHPEMLVSFDGSQIIHRAHVNLGMAVALDTGLIVPVIRDADKLSLDALAACAKDLAARAKDGGLTPDDYKGSTFTVSNLGMFGIEMFTPIVNQPDAAILGVTAVEDELVMEADGTISKHQVMRLCCTFDHRAMDGAVEARFGMALRDLLQSPVEILL